MIKKEYDTKYEQKAWIVSADLGQANDWTAEVIMNVVRPVDVEPEPIPRLPDQADLTPKPKEEPKDPYPYEYHVRSIERYRGLSYVDVAKHIKDTVSKVPVPVPMLLVDYGGVGRMMVDELKAMDVHPIPISVHGYQKSTGTVRTGFSLAKVDMVGAAQLLLSKGLLRISDKLPLKDVAIKELLAFRAKPNVATGNVSFENLREGDHDDIVFALGMACYVARELTKRPSLGAPPIDLAGFSDRWGGLHRFR